MTNENQQDQPAEPYKKIKGNPTKNVPVNKKDKDFYWKNLLSSDFHLNNSTAKKYNRFFRRKKSREAVLKVKKNLSQATPVSQMIEDLNEQSGNLNKILDKAIPPQEPGFLRKSLGHQ